jgi:hypothetical protein
MPKRRLPRAASSAVIGDGHSPNVMVRLAGIGLRLSCGVNERFGKAC